MNIKQFTIENIPFIGLLLLMVLVAMINENFLTVDNLLNIFRQTSINAIIAMGMTFVILTAGIDLSSGSILAFAGAVCATLIAADVPLIIALPGTLVLGAALGAASGTQLILRNRHQLNTILKRILRLISF